jgi:uncharacterized protein YndB with AHSA1/START domain
VQRIIRTIIAAVVVFILIVAAVGLFLPNYYSVKRSMVIDASPEKVHEYVGDLSKWEKWSPWEEEDPTLVVTLGEKTSGVGASESWVSDSGDGAITITESSPSSGVKYDLLFNGGEYESEGSITYEALPEERTKVTWAMSGDMGKSVTGGYFALLMDSMVGNMFDKGLVNLKRVVESKSENNKQTSQ